MDNLYERLLELLGKPRYSPDFQNFLQDLGEQPERIVEDEPMCVDAFWRTGIFVHNFSDQVEEISFHFSTAMVKSGSIKNYSGNLPCGITRTDDRVTVIEKIGLIPRSKRVRGMTESDPEDYWEYFEMRPLELMFIFDGRTKKICALSVYQSDFEKKWAQDLLSKSSL